MSSIAIWPQSLLFVVGGGLMLALLWNVVVAPAMLGYRALAGTGWTRRRIGRASWAIAFVLGVVSFTVWRVI